jgi:hypothetical protein
VSRGPLRPCAMTEPGTGDRGETTLDSRQTQTAGRVVATAVMIAALPSGIARRLRRRPRDPENGRMHGRGVLVP